MKLCPQCEEQNEGDAAMRRAPPTDGVDPPLRPTPAAADRSILPPSRDGHGNTRLCPGPRPPLPGYVPAQLGRHNNRIVEFYPYIPVIFLKTAAQSKLVAVYAEADSECMHTEP